MGQVSAIHAERGANFFLASVSLHGADTRRDIPKKA
jgi:hypothetical protein